MFLTGCIPAKKADAEKGIISLLAAAEWGIIPFFGGCFLVEIHLANTFSGGNTRYPSDLAESMIGCSEFERFWADMPSDSAEDVIGCSEFERFWADIPSDSVGTEIGCRACAQQTFFMPSDSVETEKGCRASAQCH